MPLMLYHRVIRQKAKKEKASLNRRVISLLDRFFGCISKKEADKLDQTIRKQRQIELDWTDIFSRSPLF